MRCAQEDTIKAAAGRRSPDTPVSHIAYCVFRRCAAAIRIERAGYDVTPADGGKQAVQLLERQTFDLLLTDLNMPEVNGIQVIAAARQRQPDMAIIVLTGAGSLATAITGLHQQIFDYLLKTTPPDQVIARVRAGLAARAQQRQQQLNVVEPPLNERCGE